MGIITAAAKAGAKKDIIVDSVKNKYDSAKDWAKEKRDNTKEFVNDPKEFVSSRYSEAKAKALKDEINKEMNKGIDPSAMIKDMEDQVSMRQRFAAQARLGNDEKEIEESEKELQNAQAKLENAKQQYGGAAKKQQVVNGAKTAAKGVGKGALVAAGAAGAVGGAALSGLRNAGRAIGGKGDGSGGSSGGTDTGLAFLFLVALGTHLLDAITQFQRPGFMIYVYVGILVYTFFIMFHMQIGNSDEIQILIVIILAYCLPYLADIFPNSQVILVIKGLLFLFPILPLYLTMKFPEQTFINKLGKWYLIFWVIVLAFYLIATFAPDQNTKALVKNPMAGVQYVMSGVSKTMKKPLASFNNALQRAIAQATGQPYDGEEESRVGIYVEDVRPVESKYNPETDVYVEAKIKAINLKNKVNVNTICWIENVHQGVVNPTVLYDVSDNYDNVVTCNLGPLKEGNYEVKVRANFEYETTSDIEYTFVNQDIKSDQYPKLDINPTTIATYTGGPVELGLPALTQPMRIKVDAQTNTQLSSYPFGVSLKNKWSQGKVVRGIRYILNTPVEVTLVDCSREPLNVSEPDVSINRNTYLFAMNTSNARDVFDAVTCRMQYSDVQSLLGSNLKNVKTFAARARFEYAVEGSTVVIVEKN